MIRIFFADGSFRDAVLVSLHGNSMRAAVAGADDVVEFRLLFNDWVSETGEVVSFQFGDLLERYGAEILPFAHSEAGSITLSSKAFDGIRNAFAGASVN